MSYCYPQPFRLKTAAQFNHVFNHAKKLSGKNFAILITPNEFGHPRLAVILAKRNISKANKRNRIKRLIRESVRLNQAVISGVDIVVLGYKSLDKITNQELSECLKRKWQRLAHSQEK